MGRLLLVIGVIGLAVTPARAVEKKAIDAAIDKGVAALRKMQRPDGTWPHFEIGATALAALTLLECGVEKDDKALTTAAAKVREAAYSLTDTYSLSLCVLFLDRLEVRTDTPLIESMLVRLLAGQVDGGWTYTCPGIAPEEARRLRAEVEGKERELKGGRDLSKMPAKGKRKPTDLPKEIQAQLVRVAAGAVDSPGAGRAPGLSGGDNSNTQFATIALWVGRRYGIPAQGALLRIDQRFRAQQHANGGWGYMAPLNVPTVGGVMPGGLPVPAAMGPTASMTCAGLLGLAVGHGASLDIKKLKNPTLESTDISKDLRIKGGFEALGTAVGKPTGWSGEGKPTVDIPKASGKAFYYLWSLERVAVAYSVETIGKNDWYQWGAEVLLTSQDLDGSWRGEYGECGADTCFALLFLKRINFARDLSSGLGGGKKLDKILKAGGVGAAGLKGEKTARPLDPSDIGKKLGTDTKPGTADTREPDRPRARPENAGIARLTDEVVRAAGASRTALLKKLRDTKGSEYTEALAGVISRLEGAARREARAALADRLTRMKPPTLREYFKDDDVEIRRAAALAAAQADRKVLIPDLIRLLSDPEKIVERAAYVALKELTGKDFGPASGADRSERAKAIAAWQLWWKKNARE